MAECGSCTLCCKLLGVGKKLPDGSLGPIGDFPAKPANEWCRHCTPGKGCGIYEQRPEPCSDFECMWLLHDGHPRLRPDKIHVVLTGESQELDAYVIHVDPAYPMAYKEPLAASMIDKMRKQSRHRNVLVITGNKRHLMTGDLRNISRIAKLLEKA